MWISTNQGFISIVAHRDFPDVRLIRARRRECLETLFPGETILETPAADYRFRVFIPDHKVADIVASLIRGIDYDNFKNSVEDEDLYRAYSAVWGVMGKLQDGGPYAGRHFPLGYEDDEDQEELDFERNIYAAADDPEGFGEDDREELLRDPFYVGRGY